jgi:hypothetical protein
VKIENEEDQKIILKLIKDKDEVLTKTYTIKTQRKPIVAMIRTDKQVGEDPLTVQLDASLSKINIP